MSDAEHRFFGWNTNTDWTKCSSNDCIETIGVFAIDSNPDTNSFKDLRSLSNMINTDRSSYDNGDISYGTTLSFFGEIVSFEASRDDGSWLEDNNFNSLLTIEKNSSEGEIDISYEKDYFLMEFGGYMYTGMNFILDSASQGVEPCTVFFGSGGDLGLSMFVAKTGPLDYKPFCDEGLQFGSTSNIVLPQPVSTDITSLTITDADPFSPSNLTITDADPFSISNLTITEE